MTKSNLEGIPIHSLPLHGLHEHGHAPLEQAVEMCKVLELTDDLKPSVCYIAEVVIVEKAATLFEECSHNILHEDPTRGKCKVFLLGR